jgi:DNA-binding response OmpR family regulator
MARVLVVDDVPESVRLIEMVLRAEKHDVSIAESPQRGFTVLSEKPADLVIVDQNMPGMTGEAMLERVAMMWPHTARLMLTADPRIKNEEGRPYPVMHKPFKLAELRAMVVKLVSGR